MKIVCCLRKKNKKTETVFDLTTGRKSALTKQVGQRRVGLDLTRFIPKQVYQSPQKEGLALPLLRAQSELHALYYDGHGEISGDAW